MSVEPEAEAKPKTASTSWPPKEYSGPTPHREHPRVAIPKDVISKKMEETPK